MESRQVKEYFELPEVVSDYAKAAEELGLWNSERIVFNRFLRPDMSILELGCGAGRVSLGLAQAGFSDLTLTDFSGPMVEAARAIFKRRGIKARIEEADATKLRFASESFDACIFAFNGFMQIPSLKNRIAAASEISRVLKRGGIFIFTTHDRSAERNRAYWDRERIQWDKRCQDPRLNDFGDIIYRGDHGNIFIHSPVVSEVEELMGGSGFEILFLCKRRDISEESEKVEEFSDECLFWVSKKKVQRYTPAPRETLKNI